MKNLVYIMMLFVAVAVFGSSCSDTESKAQDKADTSAKVDTSVTVDSTEKVAEGVYENFTLSFNEGLEKAANENKNMIVDFYTDWCQWCKVMDEKTFNNEEVAKKLKDKFVTVRINAEDPNSTSTFQGHTFNNIELTRAFRVTGFPSLGFISPEKEVITVMPGYIPADKFIYILDYVDQKCWEKKMSLDEFMKKKGECESAKTTTTGADPM